MFALGMVLLLLPVVLQLIFGWLLPIKRLKLHFSLFSTSMLVLHIALFLVSHRLIANGISDENGSIHCGLPLAAFFFYGVATLIVLIVVVLIQSFVRKSRKNKA